MGGATLGYALARAGHSVTFLERGRQLDAEPARRGQPAEAFHDFTEQREEVLAQCGRCSSPLRDAARGDAFVPYVGSGTGGSSSLYGMVLERLFPSDFAEWPLSYGELAPWYAEAEALFEVRGTADPLRPEAGAAWRAPEALSPANEALFGHLAGRGLHPYRLPLAARRPADCRLCQGYLCPAERCKNDAGTVCLRPAVGQYGARLVTGVEVERLVAKGGRVVAVEARMNGQAQTWRAKTVVLAGGALSTPAILLRSGNLANQSGQVGRRLMRHLISLYVLSVAPRFRQPGEAKELGLSDFYDEGGTVQAFGATPTLDYLRRRPGRNLWRMLGPAAVPLARCFAGAPIIAGIAEDEPRPENRIGLTASGEVEYAYSPARADRERQQRLNRALWRTFARFGALRVFGTSDRDALGHVCGTAVMGDEATRSVVNRENRAHELENLYIVDGSWFPTSGAMNPALTIAANALRVAQHLMGSKT